MSDTASIQHLKFLAQEFARAAQLHRGEIVLEFDGAGKTVPALNVIPFAAKTEKALRAAQSRDYKGATATLQELYDLVRDKMTEIGKQTSHASGKDKEALRAEYQAFRNALYRTDEALHGLQQEERRELYAKAAEDPVALLQMAQELARYPRQLGNDNIMTLIIDAARNMVRQEEKLHSMAQEIESLKSRLDEKDSRMADLAKVRLPPRSIS